MTGGLLGMASLIDYFVPGYSRQLDKFINADKRRLVFICLMIITLFFASFLAWKDKYEKVEELQQQLIGLKSDAVATERLRNQVGSLKARIEELEQRTGDRQIRQADRVSFIKALASSGIYVVDVQYHGGDSEATAFADNLADLFRMSGWKVNSFEKIAIMAGPSGVLITTYEDHENRLGASILFNLLQQYWIKSEIRILSKVASRSDFKIYVGPK